MNRTVRLRVWMLTLIVLTALVIGVGAGSSAKTKPTDAALASTSSTSSPLSADEAAALAKTYDTLPFNQITVPPTTEAPTTTVPAGPKTSFGEGVWEVNVDIAPGKYKSAGGQSCYWKKNRANGDIIDNYIGAGPAVVVIEASVFTFTTSNCEEWVKTG